MTDTGRRTGLPDGICRHCHGEIVWAWLLGARQRIPLDPMPSVPTDAEYVLVRYAVALDPLRRLRARRLEHREQPGPGERLGVSHLAVCPVLAAKRDAVASYRDAVAARPDHRDPEALAEARRQERQP